MEHGDLAFTPAKVAIFVLEETLTQPTYHTKGVMRRHLAVDSSMKWPWDVINLKWAVSMVKYLDRMVEVVTFTSEEVADEAASYFLRCDIPVFSCTYMPFEPFCDTLKWRLFDIDRVYDADPERLTYYGQLGYRLPSGL